MQTNKITNWTVRCCVPLCSTYAGICAFYNWVRGLCEGGRINPKTKPSAEYHAKMQNMSHQALRNLMATSMMYTIQ